MNEMLSRDEQVAPTLRSAEVWLATQAFSASPAEGAPSPRPRHRRAPEIAVVEVVRPAWSGWPPPPGGSLLSEVAREVATTLLDLAIGAARGRAWWS